MGFYDTFMNYYIFAKFAVYLCTTLETILWKIGTGIMWTKYSDVSKVCHYVEFLPSKSEVPGEKTPSKWCFLAITS